ncbi:MAG: hypothetical protein R2750_08710 [Bacteroidales bacterium]
MKKYLLLIVFGIILSFYSFSQEKAYFTSGGEMIFSFASINDGEEPGNLMRWTPWFNIQGMINYDLAKKIGLFSGLAIRNVGYIYDNYTLIQDGEEITVKKKFRTYNLGIPFGIKFGNLDKTFVYAGYELEFPFHYKEKTFQDEKKDKFSVWFSDRVEAFQHGLFVGFQLPYGMNIKFKYYFSSFHNMDYTESDGNKPYADLNTNIFYFSFNYNMFKGTKFDPGSE